MRVCVLGKNKQPLMPCAKARARQLLSQGKAAVYRLHPFTIILHDHKEGSCQEIELKMDPGSKVTGIALLSSFQNGKEVIFAAHLEHRGEKIKSALQTRRVTRRARRSRKTRYRAPRFKNRRRKEGKLCPSLQSRVDQIKHWAKKLCRLFPISKIALESMRFDTQKMQNPEISSLEYQRGTLFGYEVREYLFEKWKRQCAYCGKSQTRLEVDHLLPKSLGGTNRLSNLALACSCCNSPYANTCENSLISAAF
jgi:5-methylcytosine-specific restriction endonuclease McrA